jgi:hypothetical protein
MANKLERQRRRILTLLTRLGHLLEAEGVTYVAAGIIDPDGHEYVVRSK